MTIKQFQLAFLLIFLAVSSQGQSYSYYYGNIHSHTSYSDGSKDGEVSGVKTPAQAYAFAKKSKHLDFLGISEHNHSKADMIDKGNYKKGIAQSNAANEDGKFVCLYGMEYGTVAEGHVLVYGLDKLINWEIDNTDILCDRGSYNQLWEIADAYPNTFVTLAHPDKENFGNLLEEKYNEAADKVICGSAVRNGPHSSHSVNYDEPPKTSYYSYYKNLLAAGYKVGPTIDHDNHYTTFGRTSQGRTVVLAKSLTKKNIIDAYRAMRFYASDDWNTQVEYIIDGKTMGKNVTGQKLMLDVSVADPDEGDDISSIKVMHGTPGSGKLPTALITENVAIFRYEVTVNPDEHLYIYLDITQADGDKIYTSPIWVKGSDVQ